MEFRILGPLEVTDGEVAVGVDAAKERALLGVLLLHANEVVSSERLVDELWGERPPATAAKLVQTYVSHLRRVLGPDTIVTRAPGYALKVDGERIDARRFQRLTAAARDLAAKGEYERAAAVHRDALALWRGPPLADVVLESFARNEVERLEEERLSALMDRIDCDLALGRHDEVVAELEALVKQHRLRERLRAQLMLALYRAGRQADALAAYRDARRTLVDELGLEPGRSLQELEAAMLSHDAAVQAPRTAPRAPVRDRPRRRRRLALVVGLGSLAVALAAALAAGGDEPQPRRLASNSIGFIDARSGRLTKSFPVGREPRALAVAFGSVWAANFAEKTVTRVNPASGRGVTIPVESHPTGLAATDGLVWVSTFEGLLVAIDPRFDTTREPIAVAGTARVGESVPRVHVGGGFLWVTAPPIAVYRIDASNPRRRLAIAPDTGAAGSIAVQAGDAWVAGSSDVVPIGVRSGSAAPGVFVGAPVRDVTFAAGSLWVISGGPARRRTPVALRRVDVGTRLLETTILVGDDPVAVTAAAGSVWVAGRSDAAVTRVDPATNEVVGTIAIGSRATALAADENGVWVAAE